MNASDYDALRLYRALVSLVRAVGEMQRPSDRAISAYERARIVIGSVGARMEELRAEADLISARARREAGLDD